MTTPISDAASDPNAWNQLPTGFKPWPFVILSNEMLLYLAGSGEERLNYAAGDRATIRLEPSQMQTDFMVGNLQQGEPIKITADQKKTRRSPPIRRTEPSAFREPACRATIAFAREGPKGACAAGSV